MSKIILSLFAACFAVLSLSCAQSPNAAQVLPPAEFKQQLSAATNAYLLDVRTPDEYSAGHIEGAININYNAPDFKAQIEKLDKSRPVFLYCAIGGRSSKASKLLNEAGFKRIVDLKGGYNGWKAQ
jgi:rhodanese-related sulfurtransferase